MMISEDVKERFLSELKKWKSESIRPVLFWRDDDLTGVSPNLVKFLQLSENFDIPIVFAAIPTGLTPDAVQLIAESSACRIAVHGYRHANHSSDAERSEFGKERLATDVLFELREGRRLVKEKSGTCFLNLFVPPWGRFDPIFRDLLTEAGYAGISGEPKLGNFATDALVQIDCQITTEYARQPLDLDFVLQLVTDQLEMRRTGEVEHTKPIGLLTHHRMFDSKLTESLETLLDALRPANFDRRSIESIKADSAGANPSFSEKPASHRSSSEEMEIADSTGAGVSSAEGQTRADHVHLSRQEFRELLLAKVVPDDSASYSATDKLLLEIGQSGIISVLRYVHMANLVHRLKTGSSILSAGCGKGVTELALALSNTHLEWTGLDFDPNRFAYANEIARRLNAQNIRFFEGDLNRLPDVPVNTYDAIVMSEVAVYLTSPLDTFSELRKMLRPGGYLMCIEPFLDDASDADQAKRLRIHTQSQHGGFTSAQILSFASDMEFVQSFNCYHRSTVMLVRQLYDVMTRTGNWSQLNLMYAFAGLDLHGDVVGSRSIATAIGFVAKKIG